MPATQSVRAEVGCELVFDVADNAAMALQVAVASSTGSLEVEDLVVTLDGQPLDVQEVAVDHGGRVHVVRCGAGQLTVRYDAALVRAAPGEGRVSEAEALVALRQSRYCPSETLAALAEVEFGGLPDGPERGRAVGDWVFERIGYELGSSGPLDIAVDPCSASRGVCRDFAHLTIAMCRALGIPARLVSVYAPGLMPMDFHAVVEVAAAGRWEVVDATKLAPARPSYASPPGATRPTPPSRRRSPASPTSSRAPSPRSPKATSRPTTTGAPKPWRRTRAGRVVRSVVTLTTASNGRAVS